MTTKDAYRQKIEAQMNELDAEIDLLAANAKNARVDARAAYAHEVDALRSKRQTVADKLAELDEASGDTWEKVKEAADGAWEDLKTGIANVAAKFK